MIRAANRLQNIEEYYFSKKLQEIQKLNEQGFDIINLGIGSPDLAPASEVKRTATHSINLDNSHGYASYRSIPELRKSMATWLDQTYQVKLNFESEILPLLGSKEGIMYLSLALLNPGDSVLIPNPGYPAYSSVAKLLDVNIVEYNLTQNNGWLPDVSELKSLLKLNPRTKLMWLNYPHMPTGTSMNEANMRSLVSFAKENNLLICNDNPYGLVLNETAPLSILSFDVERTHTCELNSLSKSFNMAGWRVGMLLGSKVLIDLVMKVKSQVDSGMFLAIQKAAIEALNLSQSWHQERNEIYKRRRKVVWEIFDQLKITYKKDQVGLFVWGEIPETIKSAEIYSDQILKNARVFLTPGFIFGTNGQRYLRASLCASEERLKDAKSRIIQGKI